MVDALALFTHFKVDRSTNVLMLTSCLVTKAIEKQETEKLNFDTNYITNSNDDLNIRHAMERRWGGGNRIN